MLSKLTNAAIFAALQLTPGLITTPDIYSDLYWFPNPFNTAIRIDSHQGNQIWKPKFREARNFRKVTESKNGRARLPKLHDVLHQQNHVVSGQKLASLGRLVLPIVDKDSSGSRVLLGLFVTSHAASQRVGPSAQPSPHAVHTSHRSPKWETLHFNFTLRATGSEVRPSPRDVPDLTSCLWLLSPHVIQYKSRSPSGSLIPDLNQTCQ